MRGDTDVEWLNKEMERFKELYEHERAQFEEFQRYSKDLETEMDVELGASKKRITELEATNRRLHTQFEEMKTRSERERHDQHTTETALRTRLAAVEKLQHETQLRLQQVEQANDNLEKRERIQAQEIVDLRTAYEKCLERCALLESGGPYISGEDAISPMLNHLGSTTTAPLPTDVLMAESNAASLPTTPLPNGTMGDNHSAGFVSVIAATPQTMGGGGSGGGGGGFFGCGSSLLSNVRRATTRVFSPHQERTSTTIVNNLVKKIEEVERQVDPSKYVIRRTPTTTPRQQ